MKHLDFEFSMGLHGEVFKLCLSLGGIPDPDLTQGMIELCIDRGTEALKHTLRQHLKAKGLREKTDKEG